MLSSLALPNEMIIMILEYHIKNTINGILGEYHHEQDFNPWNELVNVLLLSKKYKELLEYKITIYIQEIIQEIVLDLFDEKCIIPYDPFKILTNFSRKDVFKDMIKKLLQVAFDGFKLKKEILEELEEEDDPLFLIVKQKKVPITFWDIFLHWVNYKDKYGENMYYYKFSKILDKFVARLIDTFFCDAQERMYPVIRGRFKKAKECDCAGMIVDAGKRYSREGGCFFDLMLCVYHLEEFYKKDEETRKYFKEFGNLVKNYNEDLVSSDLYEQIIEKIDETLASFKNKRFNVGLINRKKKGLHSCSIIRDKRSS
ncbi:951_t:CDS:1 [Gigaspora margarita]|uniref:951_t:CDS:1 n=1 Tax=Gigaspora margarita TaxID=4874 RepID=A0ABN7WQF4_GIGMA|nr:951_t:CDS:1 [Gigaspora margarita]